jgi:hypothetical protein
MADRLELISITPTLAIDVKMNEIKDKIIKRLIDLKLTDQKYKMSNDVLLLVCNLAEHLCKDKKINKKNIVLDIIHAIYVLKNDERTQLEYSIEFLWSNKAIKKLSRFYLFCVSVREYFFKSKKE